MKAVKDLSDRAVVHFARLDRHGQLGTHAAVTQVGAALNPAQAPVEPLPLEHFPGSFLQLAINRLDALEVGFRLVLDIGNDKVFAHVRYQRPERTPDSRGRWNKHARDSQDFAQAAGVSGAGAARGHQGQEPRVPSFPHGHLAYGIGHVELADLNNAAGQRFRRQPNPFAKAIKGVFGQAPIKRHGSTGQGVREPPQVEVGIGYRGLPPAAAIAGRTGIRSGALRADGQPVPRRQPGNGAATGADGDDVDAWRAQGENVKLGFAHQTGDSAFNETDVR